jgi:hypothetical protein
MALASGTRASVRIVKEAVAGTSPAGLTALTNVGASATGTGTSGFTRASGSFVTDGYVVGQKVQTLGFTDAPNNGTWVVSAVSALTLTVFDAGDVITTEAADVSQSIRIVFHQLRLTSRQVGLEKNLLESEEVDADGIRTDVRHGFNRVVGSPGYELSLIDNDILIELALGGTWETPTTGSITMEVAVVSTTVRGLIRSSGSFINDGFRIGDIVTTSGFSNAGNNGQFRINGSLSATTLNFEDIAQTMVTEASAASRTMALTGRRMDAVTGIDPFTMERVFGDIVQHEVFRGCVINEFGLQVQPEAIVGGSISILGMSAAAMSGTSLSAVSPAALSGRSPMAAFDGRVYEAAALNAVMTGMSFTLQRNRTLNPVIGSKFSPDVFEGQADLQGTADFYFENATQYNKFVNETESSIWQRLQDPSSASQFINVVIPRVKYVGGQIDPPQEGPITVSMPFRGLKTALAAPSSTTRNSNLTIQVSNAAA